MRMAALASLVALALGCGTGTPADVEARGAFLFGSSALSPSPANAFSCATCHAARPGDAGDRILPGAPLAGAPFRATFWGGQENDLLQSINTCRSTFMLASQPLAMRDPDALALYDYLVSLGTAGSDVVAFTVTATIADVPRGDESRGRNLFSNACGGCHGSAHDGVGRISNIVPVLPDDTLAEHSDYTAQAQRLVFVEKVRHGCFFGYGGEMPPFATEALRDADVGDLLEFLGVTGTAP